MGFAAQSPQAGSAGREVSGQGQELGTGAGGQGRRASDPPVSPYALTLRLARRIIRGMKASSLLLVMALALVPAVLPAQQFRHTGLGFRGIKLGMDRPELLEEIRASGWTSRGRADQDNPVVLLPANGTNGPEPVSVSVRFEGREVVEIQAVGPSCGSSGVPGTLRPWVVEAIQMIGADPSPEVLAVTGPKMRGQKVKNVAAVSEKKETAAVDLLYTPPDGGVAAVYSARIVIRSAPARKK